MLGDGGCFRIQCPRLTLSQRRRPWHFSNDIFRDDIPNRLGGEDCGEPTGRGCHKDAHTPPPLFFFFYYGIHSLMSGGYPPTAIGYPPTAIGYPPTAFVGRIGHSEFFFLSLRHPLPTGRTLSPAQGNLSNNPARAPNVKLWEDRMSHRRMYVGEFAWRGQKDAAMSSGALHRHLQK